MSGRERSGDVDRSAGPDDAAGRDSAVPGRIFLGIALFMGVIATVYWLVSYEDAGTVMLALACALALLVGGWLFRQDRHRPSAPTPGASAAAPGETSAAVIPAPGGADTAGATEMEHPYLPEASIWPFGMGLGALATLNGLILGWTYAVPGAAFLVLAVAGFIAQGRRRDLT